MMNNYVPFLKLKVNEVGALKSLTPDIKEQLIPFFDFPQKAEMDGDDFADIVVKAAKKTKKNLNGYSAFFLDNFDIGDHIRVNGKDNYSHVIDTFSDQNFIPVIGLDRAKSRTKIVLDAKRDGRITSDTVALRLQVEDFEDFDLVANEIGKIANEAGDLFQKWILILDNKVCLKVDVSTRSELIANFIARCNEDFDFDGIVITGSSIPASIGEIVGSVSDITHDRLEIAIYRDVVTKTGNKDIMLGDYTIVSPLYSDLDIPPEAMRNVTAPKITYSYESVHYIERGGSLKAHARGALQYNDIAANLIAMPFFRGEPYSYGDKYLVEKAGFGGAAITPSSILNPTINAHITFMCKDFSI